MLMVLGSRNPKKLKEIIEILGDLQAEGLEFADLTRFPQAPEVVEDGSSFEANARKKASTNALGVMGSSVNSQNVFTQAPGRAKYGQ